jgi:hypothetical protein
MCRICGGQYGAVADYSRNDKVSRTNYHLTNVPYFFLSSVGHVMGSALCDILYIFGILNSGKKSQLKLQPSAFCREFFAIMKITPMIEY